LIEYAPRATQQIAALLQHYEQLQRDAAANALLAALRDAERRIGSNPAAGLAAPRPYPALARPGRVWIKAGRYWIAYRAKPRLVIVAVFFDTANIPGRL
jgi:plasmid stabilization system protein ParE